ncbi:hypothetical protein D8852_09155 [Streptococcus mitis]|jgi:hypothetical protein|uniref:hypothetical protein n=1 Tax=Streptococcus mitis TaxID=28037 RepID=UPI000FABF5C6|nr:hypothetical protein [Streptococcus mitis]RSI78866.1 hypothetical protein D8852_09155 [Streptococcus mitis]
MKNGEKKPVGSLLTRKILEDIKAKKIDFIADLIIAGFIFYIIRSILTGLGSVIE